MLATCTDLLLLSIDKDLHLAGSQVPSADIAMEISMAMLAPGSPASCMQVAMADKVARALNLLGADRDLFNSADGDAFLDLIDEYLDNPEGT